MNSSELVALALAHREPDRVPLDIGGTRVTGIHAEAYQRYRAEMGLAPSDPRMMVRFLQLPETEEDFRLMLGADIESAYPVTAAEECQVVREKHGLSYCDRYACDWFMPDGAEYFDIRRHPLACAETAAGIDSFPWPSDDSPAVLDDIATQARVIQAHGRAVVLGRTCPGIFETMHFLCGYEKTLMDLALNPDFSEHLMDRILEQKLTYYRAAIDRLLAAGIDYFIVSEPDDLGAQDSLLISPNIYRRMIKPRHARLFEAIKSFSKGRAFIELHCCGAIRELIPDFIESGVQILNPVQVNAAGMDDTKALKRDFGDALVFHGGGVDTQNTLVRGTPAQVKDEVRRRMDDLAPGGGFIFSPVHSIQPDVPYANFAAMIEAYRECA